MHRLLYVYKINFREECTNLQQCSQSHKFYKTARCTTVHNCTVHTPSAVIEGEVLGSFPAGIADCPRHCPVTKTWGKAGVGRKAVVAKRTSIAEMVLILQKKGLIFPIIMYRIALRLCHWYYIAEGTREAAGWQLQDGVIAQWYSRKHCSQCIDYHCEQRHIRISQTFILFRTIVAKCHLL